MKWMGEGNELVICTHGKGGAIALTKVDQWIEMPIISDYEFKDANGAGDSFFSGFLYGHLKGESVANCMKYVTIVAGLYINSYELAFEDLTSD